MASLRPLTAITERREKVTPAVVDSLNFRSALALAKDQQL